MVQKNNRIDVIQGTSGNDRLIGNDQNNVIYGYAGNDYINSGEGLDTVWGGDGDDTIVTVNNGNGYVDIRDMQVGDKILFCGCVSTRIEMIGNDSWIKKNDDIKAVVRGVHLSQLFIDFEKREIIMKEANNDNKKKKKKKKKKNKNIKYLLYSGLGLILINNVFNSKKN